MTLVRLVRLITLAALAGLLAVRGSIDGADDPRVEPLPTPEEGPKIEPLATEVDGAAATIQRTREPAQTGGALLATMGGGGDATTTLDEADAALPVTVGGDDEQLRGVASTAARLSSRPYALTDKSALPLDVSSKALDDRCQQHVDDVLRRAAVGEPAPLMADALENVRIAPTNGSADVRVVYFIGVGPRTHAHLVVQRLLYALYAPSHLFLIHLDVKATETAVAECFKLELSYANVHVLRTRRLVQWGMFSMVVPMLDAIKAALDFFDQRDDTFDYLINLSDADLALRTDAEVRPFLARIRPRSMINVHDGGGPQLKEANDFINNHTVVECGGYGFVAVNRTADTFALTFGCCIGRSGPAAFGDLPIATHELLTHEGSGLADPVHTGSQWAVLHIDFCRYLLTHPDAIARRVAFERRLVPDESFLQTTVMHSPFRHQLINHNMRWIDWPHTYGDPNEYWTKVGMATSVGGPKALNASELAAVFGSPYMFARKLDLDLDPNVLRVWDPWMAAKLAGGRPAPPQAPIGHSPGDPDLSIRFRPPGMRDEAGEARLEALGRPRRRRVARIDYEDGSSCGCGEACEANDGGCCEGAHAAACDASAQQLEVDYEGVPLERCPTPPAGAKSRPGGAPIQLGWISRARHPVRLVVLDYEGNEIDMVTLARFDDYRAFNTHERVVWRALALNGELLEEFDPQDGAGPQTVVVRECAFRFTGYAASRLYPALDKIKPIRLDEELNVLLDDFD